MTDYADSAKIGSASDNRFIGLGNYAAAPHTAAPKVILSSSDKTVIVLDMDGKSYDKSQRDIKAYQNEGYLEGFASLKQFDCGETILMSCNMMELATRLLVDR